MLFQEVQIKNFRSIKDISIKFDQKCRVLVGMNESGKSNILNALSLLSEGTLPSDEDLRQPLPDEPIPEQAYVRFLFRLSKEEVDKILAGLSARVLGDFSIPIISHGKTRLSLREFFEARSKALWHVDVIRKKKYATYWALEDGYKVLPGWRKIDSTKLPSSCSVTRIDGGDPVPLAGYTFIDTRAFLSIDGDFLAAIDPEDLNDLVGLATADFIEENLPKCQMWSYADSNLLPAQVSLSQFSANPDICIPLKQIFELAEVKDIPTALADARRGGIQLLRNLLDRVGQRTTQHVKKIWSELNGIDILLEPNGDHIDISVRDSKNRYAFSKRSDGFKRFITFLLMISAKARTGGLKNSLLLMDEPDIGLHPSGAQYLRDELFEISSSSYVVYSTHSIFMIDRNDVSRHLLVRKDDEITTVRGADSSNILDEEVLYEALGYSVFQSLRAENFVFEGWKDKRLFRVAVDNLPGRYKSLGRIFKDVGLCHLQGVKDAGRVSAILEVGARSYLIVSDSDQAAVQAQAKFKGDGAWKRYDEIYPAAPAETSEDFIKVNALSRAVNDVGGLYPGLPLMATADIAVAQGRLKAIRGWLEATGIILEKQAKDAFLSEVKNYVFDHLVVDDIEPQYFELLKSLAALLPLKP
ncbi:MAG: hypothetical protein ABS45_16660 [Comamonas sp. SCN 65-56]|uniref:AAA family ATPase n=1 Tax=Comamonas sp. SCN 65-56 TaxID=1660095 RepID=UPI00086B3B33|nr:AAA family ATPase [Comamonas sp. SCN 65-56]ODS89580.1 MAG: hypothetical protein ABS45_16660 [Comamonas sp. SCN 65-56]